MVAHCCITCEFDEKVRDRMRRGDEKSVRMRISDKEIRGDKETYLLRIEVKKM